MKKLIFLLLLAQAISCLYAGPNCISYRRHQGSYGMPSDPSDKNAWRWGIKPKMKVQCYCNCASYTKGNNKCPGCGHTVLPVDMTTTATPMKVTTKTTTKPVKPAKIKKNKKATTNTAAA